MNNYTRDDLAPELMVKDLSKISIESYLKALTYAYPGISRSERVPARSTLRRGGRSFSGK